MQAKFARRLAPKRPDWRAVLRAAIAKRSLARDLWWGIGWGAGLAAWYSLLVLGLALLRGSTEYPQYGLTTWRIIGLYWFLGLAAGAVTGLLRPLCEFELGAGLVGWAAGAAVYGGIGLAMDGPRPHVFVFAALLGLGGAWFGVRAWERDHGFG